MVARRHATPLRHIKQQRLLHQLHCPFSGRYSSTLVAGGQVVAGRPVLVPRWAQGRVQLCSQRRPARARSCYPQVSIVPGSNGRSSPRWSPDGRNIVALDVADHSLRLFDIETRKWSLLQSAECEFPAWSSDARFVYCLRGSGVFGTRVADGVSEQVIDLTGFRSTGAFAGWMGLDPDDAPLLLRDLGNDDIYALTLEEK